MPDLDIRDLEIILASLCLLLGIFATASTSIGIKAYNENKDYKERNKKTFNFLIFCLVASLIILILSGTDLGLIIKNKVMALKKINKLAA
jgi:hypothetical protein